MNIKNIAKIFTSDFWSEDQVKKPQRAKIVVEKDSHYVMLTTSQILRIWLINKMSKKEGFSFRDILSDVEKKNHLESKKPDLNDNPTPQTFQVYFIAVILDGVVVDILRAPQQLADYLLSEPRFELFSPSVDNVVVGSSHVNGEWVLPEKHSHD